MASATQEIGLPEVADVEAEQLPGAVELRRHPQRSLDHGLQIEILDLLRAPRVHHPTDLLHADERANFLHDVLQIAHAVDQLRVERLKRGEDPTVRKNLDLFGAEPALASLSDHAHEANIDLIDQTLKKLPILFVQRAEG